MSAADERNRRLVPRHGITRDLPILWNTHPERRRWKPAAAPEAGAEPEHDTATVTAHLRDISLGGALIEVPRPTAVLVGDVVEVMLGERRALVEVRHIERTPHGRTMLFGVAWVDRRELEREIDAIVTHLRGNDAQLRHAWDHAT